MNLVLNARDAKPAGGRLTIATTSTQLDSDYGVRYGVAIRLAATPAWLSAILAVGSSRRS